jgi:transposase-like protein
VGARTEQMVDRLGTRRRLDEISRVVAVAQLLRALAMPWRARRAVARASWQRCRTHYAANLMSVTPKSSCGWVKALLHSVYDQPDAESAHAQFDRILDALDGKLPVVAEHLEAARPTSSPSPHSHTRCGAR